MGEREYGLKFMDLDGLMMWIPMGDSAAGLLEISLYDLADNPERFLSGINGVKFNLWHADSGEDVSLQYRVDCPDDEDGEDDGEDDDGEDGEGDGEDGEDDGEDGKDEGEDGEDDGDDGDNEGDEENGLELVFGGAIVNIKLSKIHRKWNIVE